METMVVVAIIAIVASVVFAVSRSSMERAFTARELAQIRQVYVAVNLYEADYDRTSPNSLVNLCPTYVSPRELACPTDVRHAIRPPNWPANPWVWTTIPGVPSDLPEDVNLRSSFVNSYLYLKPFRGRFAVGRTFEMYRDDPEVGLITGIGLLSCVNPEMPDAVAGCDYRHKPPKISQGQPPMNLAGTYLTIRTDGSIAVRHRSEDCLDSDMPLSEMFFFRTPGCKTPAPASQ